SDSDQTVQAVRLRKEYWTSRWNLQPLLQSAQLTGMTVTIKSSTCESGSGFAEVQFNND
ncbi:Shiga-like toxin beta subunit, partial [Escherichia coli]|nr:Shiga-like toxin beta subunit [Escherichia coli]